MTALLLLQPQRLPGLPVRATALVAHWLLRAPCAFPHRQSPSRYPALLLPLPLPLPQSLPSPRFPTPWLSFVRPATHPRALEQHAPVVWPLCCSASWALTCCEAPCGPPPVSLRARQGRRAPRVCFSRRDPGPCPRLCPRPQAPLRHPWTAPAACSTCPALGSGGPLPDWPLQCSHSHHVYLLLPLLLVLALPLLVLLTLLSALELDLCLPPPSGVTPLATRTMLMWTCFSYWCLGWTGVQRGQLC